MAVVIDIQLLLPRIKAIGSALQTLANVTEANGRVSEPTTPEQIAAMQLVNVERGGLYEDLITLMVKTPIRRTAEAAALRSVFVQVSQCLKDQLPALEALEDYKLKAMNSDFDVSRLRGFLQSLNAGNALSFEDYCEVDARIVLAFDL